MTENSLTPRLLCHQVTIGTQTEDVCEPRKQETLEMSHQPAMVLGNPPARTSLVSANGPCGKSIQPLVTPATPDSLMGPHSVEDPAVESISPVFSAGEINNLSGETLRSVEKSLKVRNPSHTDEDFATRVNPAQKHQKEM